MNFQGGHDPSAGTNAAESTNRVAPFIPDYPIWRNRPGLKESENVGPLFDAKLNVKTMDHELYVAIRKRNPELLGLRKKRRFA